MGSPNDAAAIVMIIKDMATTSTSITMRFEKCFVMSGALTTEMKYWAVTILVHTQMGARASPPVRYCGRGRFNSARRVRPTNATLICRIIIRLWDLRSFTRDQKLFPHFSEAGAAVFAIEQVEYGGHGCPRRLKMIVEFPLPNSGMTLAR